MKRVLTSVPWILTAVGVALVVQGAWVPAKARLAQVLLDDAWAATRTASRGGHLEPTRPWPWADTWPVARLATPWSDHVVLAGAHGESLAFGPGWDLRSARPGHTGNVVVAGPRDTHFAELSQPWISFSHHPRNCGPGGVQAAPRVESIGFFIA